MSSALEPQRVTLRDHFWPLEFLRDWGVATQSRLLSRWTLVDELRIHSRSSQRVADAPPFVLLHGLVISSLYMIPLAEQLARSFEVHALDLPGYGRSEKPGRPLRVPGLAAAVAQWIRASELPRCHVVGNSFGCQVAVELALREPDLVSTVTLVGPTVDPAAPTLLRQAVRALRDVPLEPFRLWFDQVVDYCRAGPRFAPAMMRAMIADRIETKLPSVAAPALVLRGERDPIVPERWAREAVELLPHGYMAVIPRGSHCAHYAAPEATAEAISAFLARARSAS